MNFPYTRHWQRYEYVLNQGWVDNRIVWDIGCGHGESSRLFSLTAKHVLAIDPVLDYKGNEVFVGWTPVKYKKDKVTYIPCDIFKVSPRAEIDTNEALAVCIEIFEHMADPSAFVKHVAKFARYAFFTTPLASVTGKTHNPEHVMEYSREAFQGILKEQYKILDVCYQTSDMFISPEGEFSGDSTDINHTVQMAYCERINK